MLRPAASHTRSISAAFSSTKTPTGSAPLSLAAAAMSLARLTDTDLLDLGQTIMPTYVAPALAAMAASSALVIPHIFTIGATDSTPSSLFLCSCDCRDAIGCVHRALPLLLEVCVGAILRRLQAFKFVEGQNCRVIEGEIRELVSGRMWVSRG
jgi:hypothetical protein